MLQPARSKDYLINETTKTRSLIPRKSQAHYMTVVDRWLTEDEALLQVPKTASEDFENVVIYGSTLVTRQAFVGVNLFIQLGATGANWDG